MIRTLVHRTCVPVGGATMAGAEWAFCLAVGTLAYLGILGVRLIASLWDGQSPRITRASIGVATVLVAASILSIPRSNEELTLVAAVTSPAPVAADATELDGFIVSGSRVRLTGS